MASLRVVTLNFWNDNGPAEARLRHGAAELSALRPDLVLLQEVRRDGHFDQVGFLSKVLEAEAAFDAVDERNPERVIGNAILSRLPICGTAATALPGTDRDF